MNVFLSGMRLDGRAISKRELFAYLARLPSQGRWENCGAGAFSAVAYSTRDSFRPLVAQYRNIWGVGDVRLDNRGEIAALAGVEQDAHSDLQLVLAALERRGSEIVARLYGDYAFVVWDANAQKLIAARDVFGVKPLFFRRTAEHLMISSRLDPLCGSEEIDPDYVADFLIGLPGAGSSTIWKGTQQLEPGSLLIQRGSVTAQSRYWTAESFQPQATMLEDAAVEGFRELFAESVIARVQPGSTWSQLSGGLDSSAIVCMAQSHGGSRYGLNGTVTVSDSLGTGDETRFSNAVLARYPLANELMRDYWPWRNDRHATPGATDEPSPLFPFFDRDQHMVNTVVQRGGSVLLSGLGADHYMFGDLCYIADMVARGALKESAREMLHWSMQTRRSVWHTAKLNVVDPIMSSLSPRRNVQLPRWVQSDFAARHKVVDRLAQLRHPRARLGQLFNAHTARALRHVSQWVQRGPFQDQLEVRYPFLSRRLVEFTLRLPVSMRIRPQGRKWVLREAMRGIMPEEVRTRTQKGGMDARVLWTLERERPLIDALLTDPILGQIGCIDINALRGLVVQARNGNCQNTVQLLSVLGLESWLRARLDSWPVSFAAQTAA